MVCQRLHSKGVFGLHRSMESQENSQNPDFPTNFFSEKLYKVCAVQTCPLSPFLPPRPAALTSKSIQRWPGLGCWHLVLPTCVQRHRTTASVF